MFGSYRKMLGAIGIIFCLFSSVFAYSGGSGEPNNPYKIATVSDWNDLMNTPADWNDCFIMTADVNLQGITLTPVGSDVNHPFTGIFDGNSHIIRNAKIKMPSNVYVGLFGVVDSNGQIRNLGVEDVNITGRYFVGGLVGRNFGSISNCYSTGNVSGYNAIGGLCGYTSGSISNCYSVGTVSGDSFTGGLCGSNHHGSISNCYSTGIVNGGYTDVGGLCGDSGGSITNCYSTGAVSGTYNVGGLLGHNYLGNILNCYSMGAVGGYSPGGGLVGYNESGNISASFWDVNTSGQATSAGGEGKTTEEMQTLSTFTSAGWDFSYTDGNSADWFIQIDEYPILTWQISPADIYTDGRNNFRDFTIFAQYWMRKDCRVYNNHCDWADLDFDGSVDTDDLIILMSYWLESGIYE